MFKFTSHGIKVKKKKIIIEKNKKNITQKAEKNIYRKP